MSESSPDRHDEEPIVVLDAIIEKLRKAHLDDKAEWVAERRLALESPPSDGATTDGARQELHRIVLVYSVQP